MEDSNANTAVQNSSSIQDSILLEILTLVEELYTLQSELAVNLRTGCLWLTKARKGSPRADHVSALDAKRILQARCMVRTRPMLPEEFFLPAKELIEKLPFSLRVWSLHRLSTDQKPRESRIAIQHNMSLDKGKLRLRRRGAGGNERGALVPTGRENEASNKDNFGDVHLTAGFVSPSIRQASCAFSSGLDISIRAAQIIRKILALLHIIR